MSSTSVIRSRHVSKARLHTRYAGVSTAAAAIAASVGGTTIAEEVFVPPRTTEVIPSQPVAIVETKPATVRFQGPIPKAQKTDGPDIATVYNTIFEKESVRCARFVRKLSHLMAQETALAIAGQDGGKVRAQIHQLEQDELHRHIFMGTTVKRIALASQKPGRFLIDPIEVRVVKQRAHREFTEFLTEVKTAIREHLPKVPEMLRPISQYGRAIPKDRESR